MGCGVQYLKELERDIEEGGKEGFATVYYVHWFDRVNSAWKSGALKVIHDSNENVKEVIQELKNHCKIGYKNPSFLEYKGVSRNDKLHVLYLSYLNYNISASEQLKYFTN
ncbi:hypothetical protein C2G38_2182304 [Gigaspora rosea]|uniref:Uncharacterized protein n=1 Tax=Gigaspora rosea TaxID=44941 RepID=A0A397VD64_9GLOM|nr:hypothetical protein C2G38_2182304 [Gigaspora rosea]